jgi:hypothetical protein
VQQGSGKDAKDSQVLVSVDKSTGSCLQRWSACSGYSLLALAATCNRCCANRYRDYSISTKSPANQVRQTFQGASIVRRDVTQSTPRRIILQHRQQLLPRMLRQQNVRRPSSYHAKSRRKGRSPRQRRNSIGICANLLRYDPSRHDTHCRPPQVRPNISSQSSQKQWQYFDLSS